MMRLLWARALDDMRTAIVIDTGGGQLLGGVAVMTRFNMTMGCWDYHYNTMEMKFSWEWSRVIDSAEAFQESREWERPKELPKPTPLLEG